MTSWRIDLAVLTDLSASMFSATFMILLIFLSLVQKTGDPARAPVQELEAVGNLRIVPQIPLGPDNMIDMLRRHGTISGGLGVDVFDDHIQFYGPGTGEGSVVAASALEVGLAQAAAKAGTEPVQLYVFSNALYNRVISTLERSGCPTIEVSVPAALRDPVRPDEGWSRAFLQVNARNLDAEGYRNALAQLLEGAPQRNARIGSGQASPQIDGRPVTHFAASLVTRLRVWLATFMTLASCLTGFGWILWVERRRLIPACY